MGEADFRKRDGSRAFERKGIAVFSLRLESSSATKAEQLEIIKRSDATGAERLNEKRKTARWFFVETSEMKNGNAFAKKVKDANVTGAFTINASVFLRTR